MHPSTLLLAFTPFFLATPAVAHAPDVQQAMFQLIEVQISMNHVEASLAEFVQFLNRAPSGAATIAGKNLAYELAKGFHSMKVVVQKAKTLNYDAYSAMPGNEGSVWSR
ncbi:hypothetical protein EX30DRAFT_338305 [Ascodesmis nigricans]|uniref:Uncharacterized protein n=1 Tax=Ascodesmis nigricans TaxID=341454 RepID=A0A4S2N3M9_9PEZI|nr:hypothetical protein EX30DRAFT_338305 [Ascodesmis nigricans]